MWPCKGAVARGGVGGGGQALPAMLSISIPMVMRDGKACGLMITSGVMPLSVNGMSCCGLRAGRHRAC